MGRLTVLAPPTIDTFRVEDKTAAQVARTLCPERTRREWSLDFGPIDGKVGETKSIVMNPRCAFRGEKLVATDDSPTPGGGTLIQQIFVGQKIQLGIRSVPTLFFAANCLANQIMMDTCEPAITITMQVEFLISCTFHASLYGMAFT